MLFIREAAGLVVATVMIAVLLVLFPVMKLAHLLGHTMNALSLRASELRFHRTWLTFITVRQYLLNGGEPPDSTAHRNITMHNVYCSAQGPRAGADDHLRGNAPPRLAQAQETGGPDAHGGRSLNIDGTFLGCPVCGAELRRFEVKA